MNKINACLIILLLFATQELCAQSTKSKRPKVKYLAVMPDSETVIINKAIRRYYRMYGVPNLVTVSYSKLECQTREAYSKHDSIFLCLESFRLDSVDFLNVVSHEIFHTVCPDSMTKCPEYVLPDSTTIIGFNGLAIIVRLQNGWNTAFRKIEEAACDMSALYMDENYRTYSLEHYNIGLLIHKKMQSYKISAYDLIQFQKTNDVIGFVALYLSKDKSNVTMKDVEGVMTEFDQAWRRGANGIKDH